MNHKMLFRGVIIPHGKGGVKGDYCDDLNGVLVSEEGMNEPTDYVYEFLASEEKPIAFEAADRYFLGVYGNITNPEGIKRERLLNRGSCFDEENGVALCESKSEF